MPCYHKFTQDLDLSRLQFVPTILMIGTFNPNVPDNPAKWFYGRIKKNYFWEVLPRIYAEQSLRNEPVFKWKLFCKKHGIAITDVICSVQDADLTNPEHLKLMQSYRDSDLAKFFHHFELVDLVSILQQHTSIQSVYVTRSISDSFWKKKLTNVIDYCQTHNISFQPLLTPSGFAYLQQAKYNRNHPQVVLKLSDFIFMRWKNVWHF